MITQIRSRERKSAKCTFQPLECVHLGFDAGSIQGLPKKLYLIKSAEKVFLFCYEGFLKGPISRQNTSKQFCRNEHFNLHIGSGTENNPQFASETEAFLSDAFAN